MNVRIRAVLFLLAGTAVWTGCATEFNVATGRQESLMYDTEKENKIGDAVALQLEQQFKICTEVDINERAQRVLDRLIAVSDRKEIFFTVKVIDDDQVNALSLPGGYIYIFKGLMDKVKSDDQLAGVIGHEMGHITAKHALKRLQSSYGYTLLQIASFGTQDIDAIQGVNALVTSLFFAYAQQDEFESDRLGVKYARAAGYDPNEIVKVMEILREEDQRAGPRQISYFRTHPYVNERIATINTAIQGKVGFKDYLNLTGEDR